MTVLEKMEIAFQGSYSRQQISPLLEAAMQNFSSPSTEAERERWGDILVALRKNTGIEEMEILRCMRAMGPQQIEVSGAAAICATTLDGM